MLAIRQRRGLITPVFADIQHELLARPAPAPATSTGHDRASDRASMVPGLLWPCWAARLMPQRRGPTCTFPLASSALALMLMLTGTDIRMETATRELGADLRPNQVTALLKPLYYDPCFPAITTALQRLADYLDQHPPPVDYTRRRRLDYRQLLPEARWTDLARAARFITGDQARWQTARRWLFERVSGQPADRAPAPLALTAAHQRSQIVNFPLHLTAELKAALDEHSREFLAGYGITTEPITWCPPTHLLDGLDLPGADPADICLNDLHDLPTQTRRLRLLAQDLGTTIDAIRIRLESDPPEQPPRTARQHLVTGQHITELAERLPLDRLTMLYCDQYLTIPHIARLHGTTVKAVGHLLDRYDIPSHGRQRRPRPEHTWLHEQYVTHRRTLGEIASDLGVTKKWITAVAHEYGIPLRRGHHSHIAVLRPTGGIDTANR
jgi:hypothetical protein